jgi:hypothetical protein
MSNPDFFLFMTMNEKSQHPICAKENPLPSGWQLDGFRRVA